MSKRTAIGYFGVLLAFLSFSPAVQAAPKAELWQRWTAHDAASTATISHRTWNAFLARYVENHNGQANRVSYGRVTPADKAKLKAYIGALEKVAISRYSRAEQRAYWINLYNALTVKVILDHYPVKSIRDIDTSPGWFSDGPWGEKLLRIEGQEVSLDDIEHRILRPIWQDPRIHYAVNCASIGCPDLQPKAVTAANAEAYLNDGARNYINDPRGAQVRGGRLYVSSLYRWFEEDFDADGGVIAHLKRYADADLSSRLARTQKISGDDYDWALNDTTAPRRATSTSSNSSQSSKSSRSRSWDDYGGNKKRFTRGGS